MAVDRPTDAETPRGDPHTRLSAIWAPPPGVIGFFTAVNHRAVGLRFMVTAFVFFLIAGLLAVAMRLQLTLPLLGVLSPEAYNQAFTMHGSTMMFLFVVPFLEGLAIYLVPLMIGAREMAFPRLNAFGYWVFLIAGVSLYGAYVGGFAPDSGWYNYPPLTGRGFRPGANIDFWVMMITFLEVSALVAAVEIIATILKHRAPGMSLNRMPIFVWAMLITSLMIVFAMPALVLTSLMLGMDRLVGTHFFDVGAGGDPFLWQHLFWFFGHPDVYIMLLPGVGIVSMVIPIAARRALAGYTLMVVAMLIIGLLSFGVWVHHMYTVGLAMVGLNFFAAASMLITVPSAIQIFSWITTIWNGRVRALSTAMLFSLGFVILFILGGITGIMISAVPFNWQIHDTHFIVAHFHYTLVGGAVFPIFAAIYFWFPKFTGRMLDERLGRWHFWLFLVGFNVTFLLMHLTGIEGMPRRVYTYMPDLGWGWLNVVSTVGTFIMGAASLVLLWNVFTSWRGGQLAGSDPWQGNTLEWMTTSPPANYNFLHMPVVRGRDPAWTEPSVTDPASRPFWLEELTETPDDFRETIVTSALSAEPEGRVVLPGPSPWPFWMAMALAIAFLGAIWSTWLVPVGLFLAAIAMVGWHWPTGFTPAPRTPEESPKSSAPAEPEAPRRPPVPGPGPESPTESGSLPRQLTGIGSPIIWGVMLLVVIEATLLAHFGVSYFYLRLGADHWPPQGIDLPGMLRPAISQLLVLLSPIPVWWGLRALKKGRRKPLVGGLVVGVLLVAGYLVLTTIEYGGRTLLWDVHAYTSLDWTMGGYAALHVLIVLATALVFLALALRGHFDANRYTGVQALVVYWVFVAAGSLFFFAIQYLTPRF